MPDFTMSLRLDADCAANLKKLSELTNQSLASITREAVRKYVTQLLVDAHFEEETRQALKEYRETGVHVTLDEMEPFLLGNTKEIPRCHN